MQSRNVCPVFDTGTDVITGRKQKLRRCVQKGTSANFVNAPFCRSSGSMPLPSSLVMWRKTSSVPPSCAMKPNPRSAFHIFNFPVAINFFSQCFFGFRKPLTSKRGTLSRSAVDVLRRAQAPMTAREIANALVADKAPQATRKQAIDLQAAILVALMKCEGVPARWRLKEIA